jgi:uncharacterized coiled-coil protein SlyX|tara:strand:+ start:176 stop:496 length:321 start_codon:yes stop_codon:yes gene_type:complete
MNETFSLIKDVTEVIGLFFVPVMAWVLWNIVNHGKQIIVLEQKVNDSLNARMQRIEKRVGGIEEKIDEMSENVTECKMVVHDNKNLHSEISQKFDTMMSKIDNMGQ